MKLGIYAIRDVKALSFLTPTVDQTVESAQRNFAFAVNRNNLMNFNPGDFDLYRIGTYDSESGHVEGLSTPEFVCSGQSVIRKGVEQKNDEHVSDEAEK